MAHQIAIHFRVRVVCAAITRTRHNTEQILDFKGQGDSMSCINTSQIIVGPLTRVVFKVGRGFAISGSIAIQEPRTTLTLIVQWCAKERLRHNIDPSLGQAHDTSVKIIQRTAHNRATGPSVFTMFPRHEIYRIALAAMCFIKEVRGHFRVAINGSAQQELVTRRDLRLMPQPEAITILINIRDPVTVFDFIRDILIPGVIALKFSRSPTFEIPDQILSHRDTALSPVIQVGHTIQFQTSITL